LIDIYNITILQIKGDFYEYSGFWRQIEKKADFLNVFVPLNFSVFKAFGTVHFEKARQP